MNIEFIHPPESINVIGSVESVSVPSITDKVHIDGIVYRVYNVEWHIWTDKAYTDPSRMGVIVNLIEDDIDKYRKIKEVK